VSAEVTRVVLYGVVGLGVLVALVLARRRCPQSPFLRGVYLIGAYIGFASILLICGVPGLTDASVILGLGLAFGVGALLYLFALSFFFVAQGADNEGQVKERLTEVPPESKSNLAIIRTILIVVGIIMVSIVGPVVSKVVISIGLGLTVLGCYLWTRLKNRHWAFMLLGLVWPFALLVFCTMPHKPQTD